MQVVWPLANTAIFFAFDTCLAAEHFASTELGARGFPNMNLQAEGTEVKIFVVKLHNTTQSVDTHDATGALAVITERHTFAVGSHQLFGSAWSGFGTLDADMQTKAFAVWF